MEQRFQPANGIRLHYVEQGTGPLVLMLHGFPDFWRSWRRQLPALTQAGYRVIALDLRGYHLSERPQGVAAYQLDTLTSDVAGLIAELGGDPPVVVGHDWGGVIAWQLAMHHRESLRSLIVLNAPHPAAFERELKRLSSQWLRSWYALLFQLPKLPEAALSVGRFALLKRALRQGPADSDEELEHYLAVFTAPGALTAALNYYRAAVRYRATAARPIHCPTLLLWGERDPFLASRLADGLQPWVPELKVTKLPGAAHWLQLSHADQVNEQILAFLQQTTR